mgnify:CR=1 FL=1
MFYINLKKKFLTSQSKDYVQKFFDSIKDKKQFLENCYNWLQPGGVFILHLVDMYNFDPIIPASTQLIKKIHENNDEDNNKRITESFVNFDNCKI